MAFASLSEAYSSKFRQLYDISSPRSRSFVTFPFASYSCRANQGFRLSKPQHRGEHRYGIRTEIHVDKLVLHVSIKDLNPDISCCMFLAILITDHAQQIPVTSVKRGDVRHSDEPSRRLHTDRSASAATGRRR